MHLQSNIQLVIFRRQERERRADPVRGNIITHAIKLQIAEYRTDERRQNDEGCSIYYNTVGLSKR